LEACELGGAINLNYEIMGMRVGGNINLKYEKKIFFLGCWIERFSAWKKILDIAPGLPFIKMEIFRSFKNISYSPNL
jgi:hypothetical protein